MRAIVEHRVQAVGDALQQVIANNDQRNAAWAHVLLRASVDESVFLDPDGVRQNVR